MTNGGGVQGPDETRPDAQPLRPYGAPNVPEPPAPPISPPVSQPVAPPPYPVPGSGPPYGSYTPTRTSGLAIASMVLGIVWIFWLGSILAVIFAHIALSQIKRSMGALGGRGMAIAGLVLGYIGLASLAAIIVLAATGVINTATPAECRSDRAALALAEAEYHARNGHYTDEQTLSDDGYITNESDLHSIELIGGGPSTATDYVIVDDDPCD